VSPDRRLVPLHWDESVDPDADPATIPDPATTEVPEALRTEIETLMARYPDHHSATLPALAAAQRLHGWCSPTAIDQVACVMRVTPAYLSSVGTFYDMLRMEPVGTRYLYVCTSVACHLRDSKAIHDAIWEEARDQGLTDVEIREFECLGACEMAPMASVDGRYVGPLDEADAAEIVSAMKENRQVLPGRSLEDPGFALPWEQGRQSPVPGPQGEGPSSASAPNPEGPPTPPDPSPA
jgi:NADH:ubiquinone oxidoreductase subunit E